MTSLHDSCHVFQHQRPDHEKRPTQIDFTTCGHPNNTYTLPNTEYVKRIDYIFYRLITRKTVIGPAKVHPCQIDRIECSTKCSVSGLSFSDHQPVAIRLQIFHNELCHEQQQPQIEHRQQQKLNDCETKSSESGRKDCSSQPSDDESDASIDSYVDSKAQPLLDSFANPLPESFQLEMMEIEEPNSIAQLLKNRKPSGNASSNESTPSSNRNRSLLTEMGKSISCS